MAQAQPDEAWQRYGRALIAAMGEVLEELDDNLSAALLETADFWLGVGLVIGLDRADEGERLLAILQEQGEERSALQADADDLLAVALR